MPPKPPPAQQAPVLSRIEQQGVNQAQKVMDTESEQFKSAINEKRTQRVEKNLLIRTKTVGIFPGRERKNQLQLDHCKKRTIRQEERTDQQTKINRRFERKSCHDTQSLQTKVFIVPSRIKHIMLINQDQQSELRKDVQVTLKQLEDQHRIKQRALKTDLRALHVSLKEQQLSQQNYIFALKAQNDKRQTELRQQFERQANDLKKKYDLKMQKVRNEMENYRKNLIKQLQDKKDEKIKKLTTQHTKKYSDIKAYYTQITATNLDLIKQLKNEIKALHQKQEENKRLLSQIQRERRQLVQPYQQLKLQIKKYRQDLLEQQTIIKEKQRIKKEIDNQEKLFRQLQYQFEVKMQSYKYKEAEREKSFQSFNNTVYSIQQREGLSNLILEKKIGAVSQELQVKNLQLNQVLKAAHIDGRAIGAISKSIQEIQNGKNDLIGELQNQLQQIRRMHTHMVKAYEGKLAEFVIPVQELGFDPLVPTNVE